MVSGRGASRQIDAKTPAAGIEQGAFVQSFGFRPEPGLVPQNAD
jgi:hypothetical protein